MRALAVTPIHLPPEEIRRRQARYERLAPPGLTVELRDVGPAAPGSLDDENAIRASEREVAATLARAGAGSDGAEWDVAFPDCVLDPAVPDTSSDQELPVHGLLKLSSMQLAAKNVRFGAVVRNEAIGAELGRRLRAYGLDAYVAGIAILELPFDAIADADTWNAALAEAVDALTEAGAAAVLNGCSAVDVDEGSVVRKGRAVEEGSGVKGFRRRARVVDPTALALKLLPIGRGA